LMKYTNRDRSSISPGLWAKPPGAEVIENLALSMVSK